ncbi:sister chromatid cohesion protein DCC1 [Condylostylus longicornis]|uniref:sister chromatid cohesion protein DCC1 n=1 Tax=Condylostylus longicornis TaxID=2530218 RepID=UPI00244E4E3F|nr:sister chromatid cohesion protein DCC1 [Condylostylus longicornis]
MEFEDGNLYVRNIEDVESIIDHAKLDRRNLTEVAQAIYYPKEEAGLNNLKLLELDSNILNEIKQGNSLYFKGGLNEKVVLCTENKTYEVKEAEISNSLMLCPNLKFAQATSTSPLKSPKNQNTSHNSSLNDSADDDIIYPRQLEHCHVLKIFHEYFECREIQPRFRKLGDLLQLTRYSGPENEYCIDKKLKFTFEQLLNTIQCSKNEFLIGLKKYRALEIDGYMRVLDYEYEYRIINIMLGLINENSWQLNEIDREVSIEALQGIAPHDIVEGLFDLYTTSSGNNDGKFQYNQEMVAKIIAKNILQPGLKFRIDEFMNTWQEAVPENFKIEESYLRGLGIIDRDSALPCVKSLCEDNLSTNLHERLKTLFKTKHRWTLDELEPYIEYFSTPTLSVSSILAKYARSVTVNGQRYYVAKHL